ncbi:MAG: XTP/dITP diphosphatase [Christensenellales bacterium]
MQLIIASSNKGKINEIKEILGGYFGEILSMNEAGLSMAIEETGATFMENAILKAKAVYEATGKCALADDSGLAVDALCGAPGVYSARYSGENATDEKNNQKLLKALSDVPAGERTASFQCCLALVRTDPCQLITAEGECRGEIGFEPKGENGFGYDPLFYVPAFGKTFGELDGKTKNMISHRSKALAQLKELLDEEKYRQEGKQP